MNVRVCDSANNTIAPSDLSKVELWNDTLEHICATVIGRLNEADQSQNAG